MFEKSAAKPVGRDDIPASARIVDAGLEAAKKSLGWILANGQTIRWATEKVVLRQIMESAEFGPFWKSSGQLKSVDIGCGGGRYLIDFLVPRSSGVVGLEFNSDHVALARARIERAGLSDKVKIFEGSADELPLSNNSIDFALCTQVLEHVLSPAQAVGELRRVLRTGGRGILSIPIPPDPYPNPEHLHEDFLPQRLDEMVAKSGMTILRRDYSMFRISRAVSWLVEFTRAPLPLVPLCAFEQATSKFIAWPQPHVYICVVEKTSH